MLHKQGAITTKRAPYTDSVSFYRLTIGLCHDVSACYDVICCLLYCFTVLVFLLTLHFLITLILIGLVLLQKDEESGSSSMYGGGMPQRRGSGHPLAKATYIVGGLFFANCLLMAWISSGETTVIVAPQPTSISPSVLPKPTQSQPEEKPVSQSGFDAANSQSIKPSITPPLTSPVEKTNSKKDTARPSTPLKTKKSS